MKYGSLPRSIARSLPPGVIEPDHTPDGLTEADVDALIAETGIDYPDVPTDDDERALGSVVPLRPTTDEPAVPWGNEAA